MNVFFLCIGVRVSEQYDQIRILKIQAAFIQLYADHIQKEFVVNRDPNHSLLKMSPREISHFILLLLGVNLNTDQMASIGNDDMLTLTLIRDHFVDVFYHAIPKADSSRFAFAKDKLVYPGSHGKDTLLGKYSSLITLIYYLNVIYIYFLHLMSLGQRLISGFILFECRTDFAGPLNSSNEMNGPGIALFQDGSVIVSIFFRNKPDGYCITKPYLEDNLHIGYTKSVDGREYYAGTFNETGEKHGYGIEWILDCQGVYGVMYLGEWIRGKRSLLQTSFKRNYLKYTE